MQSNQNFLFVLKFLGTNYHGWQIQKNSITVQEIFQNALFKLINSKTDIKGCSRTDSGVHANCYCVSAKIDIKIDPIRLTLALNNYLPNDIRVLKCIKVNDDFHARYSCVAKEYVYKIYNHRVMDPFMFGRSLHFWYNLDLDLMNELASSFLGYHDFTAFCSKDNRKCENMSRNIMYFNINRLDNIVEFKVKSDGFLYNMVRIMVGTILEGNYKKMKKEDILHILDSKDRSLSGPTVPAHGLYLNKVFYEGIIL